VLHLDDLMIRRTSLGDNPARAMNISRETCGIFRWDEARCRLEIGRFTQEIPLFGPGPCGDRFMIPFVGERNG